MGNMHARFTSYEYLYFSNLFYIPTGVERTNTVFVLCRVFFIDSQDNVLVICSCPFRFYIFYPYNNVVVTEFSEKRHAYHLELFHFPMNYIFAAERKNIIYSTFFPGTRVASTGYDEVHTKMS